MVLRALKNTDQSLIWEFLRLAAHEETPQAVQNAPLLARYAQSWGRAGDFGFVAEKNGVASGAIWARLYSASAPGFGFVSAQIPELSLAVRPETRGRGVASALLQSLIDEAKIQYLGLSLSVRKENLPAVRLYEKFGFETVAGSEIVNRAGGVSVVMRLNFV